jgi:hypothetical protein
MELVVFIVWFVIIIVVFYVLNEIIGYKRFASVLLATLIASIVAWFFFKGIQAETYITAIFVVFAIYGFTETLRSFRVDFGGKRPPSIDNGVRVEA